MKSIIQTECKCYRCGCEQNLHLHHIFEGTANRKKSDKWGLTIYLCGRHHNLSNEGIHFDKEYDLKVKKIAQDTFECLYGHDMWMREFRRNYLDD